MGKQNGLQRFLGNLQFDAGETELQQKALVDGLQQVETHFGTRLVRLAQPSLRRVVQKQEVPASRELHSVGGPGELAQFGLMFFENGDRHVHLTFQRRQSLHGGMIAGQSPGRRRRRIELRQQAVMQRPTCHFETSVHVLGGLRLLQFPLGDRLHRRRLEPTDVVDPKVQSPHPRMTKRQRPPRVDRNGALEHKGEFRARKGIEQKVGAEYRRPKRRQNGNTRQQKSHGFTPVREEPG